jgi:D-3-phosphoglycerate dehydrogenase
MSYRVAIGPSTFAEEDRKPLEILEKAGFDIVPNRYKRRLTEAEICDHLKSVDGLIAGLEPLNRKVLQSAKQLKAIARVGIGMDNVDIECASKLNIKVSNTPDGPTEAVAELCLTALLSIQRQLISHNYDMHNQLWQKRIGQGIKGTIVLLIGYGRIGRRFGDLLRFLGAEIFVSDPYQKQEDLNKGENLVSLEKGLSEAEVISLHAGGKDIILGEKQFETMNKEVVLLNSARGELVDEVAIIKALENGTIKAAWFDAFWTEPYIGQLTQFQQVLLTPHASTLTRQCRRSMEETAVRNLINDLELI